RVATHGGHGCRHEGLQRKRGDRPGRGDHLEAQVGRANDHVSLTARVPPEPAGRAALVISALTLAHPPPGRGRLARMPRQGRLIAGVGVTAVAAVALALPSIAAAAPLATIQVAKHKDGPFKDDTIKDGLSNGDVHDYYFKV